MAQNAVNRSNNIDIFPNNIELPETDSTGSVGVVTVNSIRFIHTGDNGNAGNINNVFVGAAAGNFSTTASQVVGVGNSALSNITSAGACTALGYQALLAITDGGSNIGIGYQAGSGLQSDTDNIALGVNTLTTSPTNPRSNNTAIGTIALSDFADGNNNVAIGRASMESVQAGTSNVAVGNFAMRTSGTLATGASQNTALGEAAFNNVGNNEIKNVAVGYRALRAAAGGTNPREDNVSIGPNSLSSLTDGNGNVALGEQAGVSCLTGQRNTLLGFAAGFNFSGSESSNIAIGTFATAGDNNVIKIGTPGSGLGEQNSCFIAGVQGVTPSGTNEAMIVDNNNQLGSEPQLALSRGGTGLSATPSDGELLIGGSTNSDFQLNTLTAGSGIIISNNDNSITISAASGTTTLSWNTVNSSTQQMSVGNGYIVQSGTNSQTSLLMVLNDQSLRKEITKTGGLLEQGFATVSRYSSEQVATRGSGTAQIFATRVNDAIIHQLAGDFTPLSESNYPQNTILAQAGVQARGIAASSSDVYVAASNNTAYRFTPGSNFNTTQATNTDATARLNDVAVDSDWVYVGGDDNTLRQLDTSTLSQNATYNAGDNILQIEADGTAIYITTASNRQKVDPTTMSLGTSNSNAGGAENGLALDGSYLYTLSGRTITQANLSNLSILTSNTAPSYLERLHSVAADGTWVYTIDVSNTILRQYDPSNNMNIVNTKFLGGASPGGDESVASALATTTTDVGVEFTLPANPSVGDRVAVSSEVSNHWSIIPNSGQSIYFEDQVATPDIPLAASRPRTSVELVCNNTNGDFTVRSYNGRISAKPAP